VDNNTANLYDWWLRYLVILSQLIHQFGLFFSVFKQIFHLTHSQKYPVILQQRKQSNSF